MEKGVSTIEIRDMRDGDWYWISRAIFEDYAPKIGAVGLALYNAYASYARNKGSAFPSQKTIAEKLRISNWAINKYNKILEENELIKIESGKGKGKNNLITLLKVRGMSQAHRRYESGSDPGMSEAHTKEKNNKDNTKVEDNSSSLVKNIINYFKNKTREIKNFVPEINWGKEGYLVKQRLKRYTPEQLKDLIDWYLDSPRSEKLGSSLAIILSTNIINLWKESYHQRQEIYAD